MILEKQLRAKDWNCEMTRCRLQQHLPKFSMCLVSDSIEYKKNKETVQINHSKNNKKL